MEGYLPYISADSERFRIWYSYSMSPTLTRYTRKCTTHASAPTTPPTLGQKARHFSNSPLPTPPSKKKKGKTEKNAFEWKTRLSWNRTNYIRILTKFTSISWFLATVVFDTICGLCLIYYVIIIFNLSFYDFYQFLHSA